MGTKEDFDKILKRKGSLDEETEWERTCTLLKVVFFNADDNFAICKFRNKQTGAEFTAKGRVYPRIEHFNYKLKGNFKWDNRYEIYNFVIKECELLTNAGKQGVINYLSREGPNVGEVRAMEIVDEFGEKALEKIKEDPSILVGTITGFTPERAARLAEWISAEEKLYSVKKMLYEVGLTPGQIGKFIGHFGTNAANVVKQECFTLTKVDGIGFLTVCKIADKLGIPKEDPHRIREGVKYAMNTLMQEGGHVCVDWHKLIEESCKILEVKKNPVIVETKKLVEAGEICKDDTDPSNYTTHPELFEEIKNGNDRRKAAADNN